jgi:hypothetical protein
VDDGDRGDGPGAFAETEAELEQRFQVQFGQGKRLRRLGEAVADGKPGKP